MNAFTKTESDAIDALTAQFFTASEDLIAVSHAIQEVIRRRRQYQSSQAVPSQKS